MITSARSVIAPLLAIASTISAADIVSERFDLHNDSRLPATMYLPAGTTSNHLPAIIVTGAWMTSQDQMPKFYAERFARRGIAALTFDFRGFGASTDPLRGYESPARKIADLGDAVDALLDHPRIDRTRIGLLGICASAGYAARVAAEHPGVAHLSLVAPWLHDAAIADSVYGARMVELLATADQAAEKWRTTRIQDLVPAASTTDARAAMFEESPTWLDYYVNPKRGAIASWPNQFDPMSWRSWIEFDAHQAAAHVRVRTLIVHSDTAAIPQGVRSFADKMPAVPEQVWIPGATQFDFYDNPVVVDQAIERVLAHSMR